MKCLYGITNNNIFTIATYIQNFKHSLSKEKKAKLVTQILGFNGKVKDTAKVILVPSVQLFITNLSALNKINAVVFVFDAAILCNYLKPIKLLDVDRKLNSYTFLFKKKLTEEELIKSLREGLVKPNAIKVTQETIDIIPNMLEEVKGSIIKPILDYLYCIPDTDNRYEHQLVIFRWLVVSHLTPENLQEGLSNITNSSLKSKRIIRSLTKLIEFLSTEVAIQSRLAIQDVFEQRNQKKPINYKKLSKKYPLVDSFDVRYILKLYRRLNMFKSDNTELRDIFIKRKLIKHSTEKKDV